MPRASNAPSIFWHSDPVAPGETVVFSGDYFTEDAYVELKPVGKDGETESVKPLQISDKSVKVVVPENWSQDAYACRIKQKSGTSREVLVNAPDIWWVQGDKGVGKASAGGWLRLLGKCLEFETPPEVVLASSNGNTKALSITLSSAYSVCCSVPEDMETGTYVVKFTNGFTEVQGQSLELHISEADNEKKKWLNVLDFGADPTGKKDSTLAVVQATERLGAFGGGIVFFPAGRYRIDSILRSGTFIDTPLKVPAGVTLKGEGMDLVSLWWPDREKPLPSLIEGSNNFSIKDLAIFTQGPHSSVICGESDVTIKNVRIRVNCFYMTLHNGKPHHQRGFDGDKLFAPGKMGAAVHIWGDNLNITNCDIYFSGTCFDVKHSHGAYIANNVVKANNLHAFSGCSEMIFENNEFSGNSLTAGGSNVALHFGASISRHVYYANNKISHIYGGDHEALTLDGHGTAYFGRAKDVKDTEFKLTGKPFPKSSAKGSMHEMSTTAVYVVDGRGMGQYRFLESRQDQCITVDCPWDVEPDETSVIAIGGFNGRHLFIGNTMSDTGTAIQLYPPNCECIVAENKTIRASNINSLSKLGKNKKEDFVRVEPSWYNQFLDNHVITGNHWGGGPCLTY